MIICLETRFINYVFDNDSDWILIHTHALETFSAVPEHDMKYIQYTLIIPFQYCQYPTFQILGYSVTLTRICHGQDSSRSHAQQVRYGSLVSPQQPDRLQFCNVCYLTELELIL